MKSEMTKTVTLCDFCREETYPSNECLACGKHICYECKKTRAVEYWHSVYFSGNGDGIYCLDCHVALLLAPTPVFLAYLKIADLQAEIKRWNDDLDARVKAAEEGLERIQGGGQ